MKFKKLWKNNLLVIQLPTKLIMAVDRMFDMNIIDEKRKGLSALGIDKFGVNIAIIREEN